MCWTQLALRKLTTEKLSVKQAGRHSDIFSLSISLNAPFLTVHSWLISRYDLKFIFDRYIQTYMGTKADLALFMH